MASLLLNWLPGLYDLHKQLGCVHYELLFADDTTLQLLSSNIVLLYEQANVEIDKLADWLKANKLTLNISKTRYMIFKDEKSN